MPETRVPARFDSSLAMRNGDRALRPRSERSSAIDATVDVKRDYTLHASTFRTRPHANPRGTAKKPKSSLDRLRSRASNSEPGRTERQSQAQHVPQYDRISRGLDQRIAQREQRHAGAERQQHQTRARDARHERGHADARGHREQDVADDREAREQDPRRDAGGCRPIPNGASSRNNPETRPRTSSSA